MFRALNDSSNIHRLIKANLKAVSSIKTQKLRALQVSGVWGFRVYSQRVGRKVSGLLSGLVSEALRTSRAFQGMSMILR